ncbi:MAG: alpha-1,4-glucan--maltose-1-phosphate maltosyltransferase [Chloroflexi bacterium]|nr:MAG: alpha-1,4-glucan--maltose-1-phosphate maltosyltransferase [Chloroflexota bacterium]
MRDGVHGPLATASERSGLRERVVVESVRPEVDGGRFPAKAVIGQRFLVEADVFAEYEPIVSSVLRYRRDGEAEWRETPMQPAGEDHYAGGFIVDQLGVYYYTIEAWIDRFETWRRLLQRKVEARQDVSGELQVGTTLVRDAAARARGSNRKRLEATAARIGGERPARERVRAALGGHLAALMSRNPDRSRSTRYDRELRLTVDPPKAVFSSWYELFPRSWAAEPGRHGTFRDVEAVLPYVAGMGFDVLYLPPVHPIGRTHRKGKNNSLRAKATDPGSPWAIGSEEGGHNSVHPELGTIADFRRLVKRSKEHGLDIALDIAFQCSPDHPYVKEHPEWFRRRPDGSIQYAENPPKKYEDIYPFDFETADWRALWDELKSVFVFWVEQGVHIFRVDNPHTKPFRFWEWVIAEVKRDYPDALFLAEAFTRPRLMERLAKSGFTQSYTYFAWKTKKDDIREYFAELTSVPLKDYFRPNAWPNTPDILTEYLVTGGRPAFVVRLVLAATLSSSYGIYGPAFELGEHTPAQPGSEEYLNSEKYELKRWDIDRKDSLRGLITRMNTIRRENRALQSNERLSFHPASDEGVICYSKRSDDARNIVLTLVNLDPRHARSAVIELPLEEWGIDPKRPFPVDDLVNDGAGRWRGRRHELRLDPKASPAAIFRLSGKTVEQQHASA